jgi:hypothetical protein
VARFRTTFTPLGRVAQLAEHSTLNRQVVGSIPTASTTLAHGLGVLLFLVSSEVPFATCVSLVLLSIGIFYLSPERMICSIPSIELAADFFVFVFRHTPIPAELHAIEAQYSQVRFCLFSINPA